MGLTEERKERVRKNLHIKPLVMGVYIKDVDPFDMSYMWDPTYMFPALGLRKLGKDLIPAKSYCGYYGLFKPSVGEVIDCIPDEILDQVAAFQIVGSVYIHSSGSHQTFQVQLYQHTFVSRICNWLLAPIFSFINRNIVKESQEAA